MHIFFYIFTLIIFMYKCVSSTQHHPLVSIAYVIQDPWDRFADFVIDARLMVDCAAESSRSDADQGPSPVVVDDQRTTGITLRNNRTIRKTVFSL